MGFSTLAISAALRTNEQESGLRGHLYSLDADKEWLENTRVKIPENLWDYVTLHYSTVTTTTVDGTLCHLYDDLPDISPNFVYLDGPDTHNVSGNVRGVGFSNERPPISADILLYESSAPLDFFVLVDGRWENCRFLRRYLKGKYRNRHYRARKSQTFEYVGEYDHA